MAEDAIIRILIVDDHPVVRTGLEAMIDATADMRVVAQAASGEAALACFDRDRPDVTLMDLRLPGMSGPETIVALRAKVPDARVLVLTSYDGDEDVYRAVQAGARGYILKGTFPAAVLEAIRAVHAGQHLIAPEVVGRLAERLSMPSVSGRELEVLKLVARGLSNKEIAAALFVSEETIKTHMRRIFAKFAVGDRTEAVLMAVQRGLIRLLRIVSPERGNVEARHAATVAAGRSRAPCSR